jgi:hypothetical protein
VFDIEPGAAELEQRAGTKPQAVYMVDTREGCERVREVFRAFPLRAKNAADVGRPGVLGRMSQHAPASYSESERDNLGLLPARQQPG